MNTYSIEYKVMFEVEAQDKDEAREKSDKRFIEHWKEGGSFDELFNIETILEVEE